MAAKNYNTVTIGSLDKELVATMAKYTQAVADRVKEAADEVAERMLRDIKADAPKRTGGYRRAMALKTSYESNYEKRVTWYARGKKSSIPHLLEMGHRNFVGEYTARCKGRAFTVRKTSGGRAPARIHIAPHEKAAKEEFIRRVKEAIERGG